MSKPARKKIQSPFAKNLKLILTERGISQKAAAEIANVTPATLNDWLAGSVPNDHIAVQRLCRALGCSFEWLLTGSDDLAGLNWSRFNVNLGLERGQKWQERTLKQKRSFNILELLS